MAKFPRSNRKKFQIMKFHDDIDYYAVHVYMNSIEACYIDRLFKSKKEARQYIASRRRAIKNREW